MEGYKEIAASLRSSQRQDKLAGRRHCERQRGNLVSNTVMPPLKWFRRTVPLNHKPLSRFSCISRFVLNVFSVYLSQKARDYKFQPAKKRGLLTSRFLKQRVYFFTNIRPRCAIRPSVSKRTTQASPGTPRTTRYSSSSKDAIASASSKTSSMSRIEPPSPITSKKPSSQSCCSASCSVANLTAPLL